MLHRAERSEEVAAECYLAALRGERDEYAFAGARLMARTDRLVRLRFFAEAGVGDVERRENNPRRVYVGPYATLLHQKIQKGEGPT